MNKFVCDETSCKGRIMFYEIKQERAKFHESYRSIALRSVHPRKTWSDCNTEEAVVNVHKCTPQSWRRFLNPFYF